VETLKPEGYAWNISFIAIIFTFDFQKRLPLEEVAENLIERKERKNVEAVFIPWEEKEEKKGYPMLKLFDDKKEYKSFNNFLMIEKEWRKGQLDERYKLFIAAIGSEKIALDEYYLKNKKFIRLKLPDVEIKFSSEPLSRLGWMIVEVHFLVHSTGIIIGTLYVRPKKALNTYQIIEFERRIKKEEVEVKIGVDTQKTTLKKYLLDKLLEEGIIKRSQKCKHSRIRYVVSIKKHPLFLCELRKHELYGIMSAMRAWYQLREEVKLKEVYEVKHFHIFVGDVASLFISSDKFEEHIKINNKLFWKKSTRSHSGKYGFLYTLHEYFEHYLITPVEFVSIVNGISERYFSKVQELSEGSTEPATFVVSELLESLQEYNNITFMEARPIWEVMKYGEKILEVPEKMEVVKSGILTLMSLIQQETQNRLTIVFGFLSSVPIAWLVLEITKDRTFSTLVLLLVMMSIVVLVGIRATLSIFITMLKQLQSDFHSFYIWLCGNYRKIEGKLRKRILSSSLWRRIKMRFTKKF
jgi:hypothetical protein